jgi:hypothetical protein
VLGGEHGVVDLVIGEDLGMEIEDAHGFLLPAQAASWTLDGWHGALIAEMLMTDHLPSTSATAQGTVKTRTFHL